MSYADILAQSYDDEPPPVPEKPLVDTRPYVGSGFYVCQFCRHLFKSVGAKREHQKWCGKGNV